MANIAPTFGNRTIDNFRSKLVGGGSRPNLFECELNFPPFISTNSDQDETLRFMIKAAQIPGSTISTIPVPFRGRTLKIAGDRTFDPWTITIINDTNYAYRNLFEKWMNAINGHSDNAGVITPVIYQREMKVYQLGRGTESKAEDVTSDTYTLSLPVLKIYKFYGCWPSDISPMDLSYDSSDTIQEFTVTMQYQWYDSLDKDEKSILGIGVSTTA